MPTRGSGGDSLDTVARGEMVESELDAIVRRRDDKRCRVGSGSSRSSTWRMSVALTSVRGARSGPVGRLARGQAERHKRTLDFLLVHHEGEAQRLLEPDDDLPSVTAGRG